MTMGIKITDDNMHSKLSGHSAGLWPMPGAGESPTMWRVSWLPERPVGRNEAISAMVLAETVSATPDLGPGHREWCFIDSWAAELGLSADEAVTRVRESAQREMGELDHERETGQGPYPRDHPRQGGPAGYSCR